MPNVYEIVRDKIVAQLEQGTVPWRKPWRAEMPCNMVSGKPYRGINVFLLAAQGYGSRYWLTFNQCAKLGGRVNKGEKGTLIVFWKRNEYSKVTQNAETGEDETEQRSSMLLRYYVVFNVMQTDLAEKLGLTGSAERTPDLEAAQTIVDTMPNRPAIERGQQAAYAPSTDTVYMPDRQLFTSQPEYFSTLFHELVHSTGHLSRLSRFEPGEPLARFGSESYSKEELIAEFGASFLCGTAGIDQTMQNSAAYIQHWSKRLREDSKLLVSAASQAQKAADFILGSSETETEE